jgi:glycerol-3-phosphate dehydrogenase
MDRNIELQKLQQDLVWDVIIIGGGATGLGAAVDAACRGYKTLLVERFDFAKGTSSRATKLVHGGVRYLAQGNIKLVRDALKERGLLLKNAPHVSSKMQFVIPNYTWWAKLYYGIGLKIYDALSGKLGLGNTNIVSAKKAVQYLPEIKTKNLWGAVIYTDGQFDDARLAINLAQTAVENGATVLNYMAVSGLLKEESKITGVACKDSFSEKKFKLKAKVVINATGVFVDDVMNMDNNDGENIVAPSQGIHIVIEKKFFKSDKALMVPKTTDGRVLFAVPWHNYVIVGTTDTAVNKIDIEPLPLQEEVNFILQNLNQYLSADIKSSDVKSVFVGLRPLVKRKGAKNTSLLARDHTIIISESKMITITGGKWTTYRKMAEEVINNATLVGNLAKQKSTTANLHIHGYTNEQIGEEHLKVYGSDAVEIKRLYLENSLWQEKIHANFNYTKAQIIWAVRNEMALTVEDVLARRLRMLFLDAAAAMAAAPIVVKLMAIEMNKNDDWIATEIISFNTLAKQYLLS